MNLMELFVKIGVDDQASSKIANIGESIGNGLKKAAEVGIAAMAAAGASITAVAKESIEAYADYEQLVGGVETLFKKSAPKVQQYAANAYKTAGLSANEYMETVTSFSASLLQSLEQDTEAAAEYADMAIRDMADNANKMGSNLSTLQTAYAGFAKGQFMLLDNLKLGYGGTKEEMERLILDAEKLDSTFRATRDTNGDLTMSYAEIVDAIHIVQTEMGITGTTAKEAGATISGSLSSMKAAWANLLVGIADENADINELFTDLVTSIVGDGSEANKGVLGNLLPRIEQVFEGLGSLGDIVRPHIENAVNSILSYISEEFASGETLQRLADDAINLLTGLADAIPGAIDTISGVGLDIISGISNFISDEAKLDNFLGSAGAVLKALIDGLADKGPDLITGAAQIVTDLVTYLLDPERLKKFFDAAGYFLGKIAEGIAAAIPKLAQDAEKIGTAIKDAIMETDWIEIGKTIFGSILSGFAAGIGMEGAWYKDLQGGEKNPDYYYIDENGKIQYDSAGAAKASFTTKIETASKVREQMNNAFGDAFSSITDAFGNDMGDNGGRADLNINIDGETVATVTYDRYKNILMQKGG